MSGLKAVRQVVRYEEVATDPTAVWRIVSASNLRPSEEPRDLSDRVPPAVWESEKTRRSVELRRITLKSTQGKHWRGAPEGNLNPPPTGYSAVPDCWGQSQLPHAFVATPTLNKLNTNSESELARQWDSNPINDRAPSFFKSLAKGPILDSPEIVGGEPLVEALDSPEIVGGEPLVEAVVQKKESTMKSFTPGDCKYCRGKGFLEHKCKHYQQVNLMAGVSEYVVPEQGEFGIPSWLFGLSLPDAVDLAVLEMDSSTDLLKPINVGQSSAIRVGQQCLAMGNPFGFDHILTADVISGLNRDSFSKAGAHFHMKQGAFLHNLEAQTLPKSLHCNFIRADNRLRLTGRFWKLPPWPDLCTMNGDRFDQHCESTLTDSLVAAAGIIVQEVVGDVSKTDTRIDEAKRGITIKSTGNSLFYEMTEISLMSYKSKMDGLDEKLLRLFASGSRAILNPMAAMLGGNVAPSDPSLDKSIQHALVVGDYNRAVNQCFAVNRIADALVIAHAGGTALWGSTRIHYINNSISPYLKVVFAMVGNDLMNFVSTWPLNEGKETFAQLCTFARKEEWNALCDTDEGELCIWDIKNPCEPVVYPPLKSIGSNAQAEISYLTWSPKFQHILATACSNGMIVVWDLRNQKPLTSFATSNKRKCSVLQWNPGHSKGVIAMSWWPDDSSFLLTCSKDNRTKCGDTVSGEIISELPASPNGNLDIHWHRKTPGVIAAYSFDGKIDIYNLEFSGLYAAGESAVGAPARPRAPAPKWLKCPTGASFGFGGKLVSFHPAVPTQGALVATSEVHVHSLVIEQSLVNRSTEFEAAIQNGNTIWQRICKHKQPIIEHRQSSNFPNAMEDYAAKLHDSSTSGAIFFAVCRGKVSEGLDFADQAKSADDLSLDIPSAVTLFDRLFSIAISEEWLDASLSKSAIPDRTIVGREDKKSSQVVRIWDPGSESKNMKWGRIETSGHMLSFNVVTEDNVEVVSPQAEAERQLMQISVKSSSVGKNIKLNVKKSNSAADVKAEIERKVGILMNKQILLYKGHQLEMMIFHLPFPSKAQEYHVENLYEEPLDDTYSTAVRNCDQDGSLMLYVSKVIPASDKGRFFAFGRAFSGKIATGLKVHILDPNYVTGQNQKTGLYVKSVQRTKTWRKLEECAAFIELNSTKVYARPIKLQVFTIAEAYDFKDLESMFQEVATVFKTKVMFIYVDIAEDNPTKPFLAFYGLKPEKLIVTSFDISKGAKYLMESDTNVKNLREFCLGLLDVTLPPYFRSELVQQEMGLVEKVVRSTFNYSVLESHENVLLEVHAPWCVDCEAISKNREKMAKHFSGLNNLKSARIDAAVSEHLKLQKLNLKNMMRFTKEKLQIAGLETVPTADNSKFSVELESFTLKSVGRIF